MTTGSSALIDDETVDLWFLDSVDESPGTSGEDEELEDGDEHRADDDLNKAFWEKQLQTLEATLYRTSSGETRVRRATKEAVRATAASDQCCGCGRGKGGDCGDCLRRAVMDVLKQQGFECHVCMSKSHAYLEVVVDRRAIIVEVGLRAEFQMAAAGDEYRRLVSRLPEVYVGRAERLRDVADIMCDAAKQCMKRRNMHLPPWRKHAYVQAKWLGRQSSHQPTPLPRPDGNCVAVRPRASMLTFDLSKPAVPVRLPFQRASVVV